LEEVVKQDFINISKPLTYKGIFAFHKYWGKKPIETTSFFIENFTNPGDIVLDPFLGSGLICRECVENDRSFIGIDLNPFAIEHAKLILDLPTLNEYKIAFELLKEQVCEEINRSYTGSDNLVRSHYLWDDQELKQVWRKNRGRKVILEPNAHDYALAASFNDYQITNFREATFFNNSRINSTSGLKMHDLFTGRALRNIDILIEAINDFPRYLQRALMLTLTSAVGQMSNMVFAITDRGKNGNGSLNEIEVGSWVIGFWRPKLHFEINVWNCFENRAKKFIKTLSLIQQRKIRFTENIGQYFSSEFDALLIQDDCLKVMNSIPTDSIKLISTDPPHGDRIPYLELSEVWNSILNKKVDFDSEIVISDAKNRNKKKANYIEEMKNFIREAGRVLRPDGVVIKVIP